MSGGQDVLVYSEDSELMLQLLGKGRDLAGKLGSELSAMVIGAKEDAAEISKYGADRVFLIEEPDLTYFSVEPYRMALLTVVEKASPSIIIIGATKRGKELAPRLAAALKTGCMSECLSLDVDERGRLLSERMTYGGSCVAKVVSRVKPHIATVPHRVFEKPEASEKKGEIVRLSVDVPKPRVSVVERREKPRGSAGLEDASIIVAAGRGFKKREDLRLLVELSDVLGARIGCTRPVAADSGWLEEWIGISGKKVKPKLYIACGISGTIQHAAGIRDSRTIVSINEDESANIFELSDYGVVGDIYKVVPALIKALREKLDK